MNIDKLIGNTPMIKIKVRYKEKEINVFSKLEYYNYTGSIKDRLANYIIKESYKSGDLIKGMPIVEATSGNTGISFAALGAYYGHPVHIFMPDWASQERINIMKLYGANIYLVSKEDGGFREAIRRADKLALEINGFRPDQFNNKLNVDAHYNGIGLEILDKVNKIDAYVNLSQAYRQKKNYADAYSIIQKAKSFVSKTAQAIEDKSFERFFALFSEFEVSTNFQFKCNFRS